MGTFSKTALKKIKTLNKNEMVTKLVELSNYAEIQKAQNMILLSRIKELESTLNKKGESNE